MEQIIREFIWDFIFDELHKCCEILIPKESKFLSNKNSSSDIYTYLFVIDRYLSNKIIPIKYKIIESSEIDKIKLDNVHLSSLNNIKKLLKNGDKSINSYSKKYIPNSIKTYFKTKDNKYVKDFSGSIWGIKHLHLNPQKHDDFLLYYVIIGSEFYFIKIGNHTDFFKKDVLEIIVNEFEEILPKLGVFPMIDISCSSHEYKYEDVRDIWNSGGNISYVINNKCYSSINLQSFSTLPVKFNYLVSNISFQIENYSKLFIEEIKKINDNVIVDLKIEKNEDFKKGRFCIIDSLSGVKTFVTVPFLETMNYALEINNFNLENRKL